ncbi:MAG: type II secretion system F family protein [Kiritimatiellae bacterium]|nr:type II secretion system F family protein [Kiritimatiellia bacterium]
MLWLAFLFLFFSVVIVAYAIAAPREDAVVDSHALRSRRGFLLWISPAMQRSEAWVHRLFGYNSAAERTLREKLKGVGGAYPLEANEILSLQLLGLATLVPALAVLLFFGVFEKVVDLSWGQAVLAVVLLAAAVVVLPILPIDSLVKARRAEITRKWSFCLDLLAIALSSGVGLQSALERVAAAIETGALAQELRRVLNEIRLGASRPQALRGFARRAGKGDVATSIEMIVQSETLGTELSSILSEQAQTARAKAMQEVEKKALQAPVKMILPMAIFIFPSILGVLVGPLFISYLQQK